MIDAHLRGLRRPALSSVFDHFANYTTLPAHEAWDGTLRSEKLHRSHSLEEALGMTREASANQRYIDVHCHVFTPESFFEVLRGCFELGLLDVEVAQFWGTAPNEVEFFVALRKLYPDRDRDAKNRAQIRSLPPPEVTVRPSVWWRPEEGTSVLIASRAGGFEGKVFFVQGGLRYWVPTMEWATRAGFRWPEDIAWVSDGEIAMHRLASDSIPASESVRPRP